MDEDLVVSDLDFELSDDFEDSDVGFEVGVDVE